MKYGYTIIYVESVEKTLRFYNEAFGFETRFLHEAGDYGELKTGDTVLAFASHALAEASLACRYLKSGTHDAPLGIALTFVTDDVFLAYEKAVAAGAGIISAPIEKPWGQVVAVVLGKEGELIEIGSPMGG